MSLLLLRFNRWRLSKRGLAAPLKQLVAHSMPGPGTPFNQFEILSLDMETTGLDSASAEMLSVGWVVIRDGRVDLKSAESHIVRPSGEVGSSASVHGLTDTIVEGGEDLSIVLSRIVEVLTGRVLLVHHAGLDKAILDRLCRRQYGVPLLVPVVDTLALERRRRERRHHVDEKKSFRLADLRDVYRLPRYSAHDSLVDAIATAELLIAMIAHNDGGTKTCLRDLCG
ncbi:MAG: exonuclease domain-containing protein [Woeseiaceae bacterium]